MADARGLARTGDTPLIGHARGIRVFRAAWHELPPAGRVALLGVLASAVVAIGLGVFIPLETRSRLLDAEGRGLQAAVTALEPALPDLTGPPLDAAALADLDRLVDQVILDSDHVRAKLWSLDGRVLYSDDQSLIGRVFGDVRPNLAEAVERGVRSEVTDLSEPENERERQWGQLVEFYVPVHDPAGRPVAVFEIYEDVRLLEEALGGITTATWLAIGSGLSILLVFLVVLVVAAVRSISRDRDLAEARAIELGGLYAEVREAAQTRRALLRKVVEAHEEERRRLVGDLHDSLASELIRVLYGIRGILARGERLPDDVHAELDDLEGLVVDVEQQLRAFMSRVRPASLDAFGLPAALEEAADRFRRESRIDVRMRVSGAAERASPEKQLVLLRAAEEALVNIRKHAAAGCVIVSLRTADGRVRLDVDDDGVGWPDPTTPAGGGAAAEAPDRGLGLAYLRERVVSFGGVVRTVRSRLGGARLSVELPLEES